MKLNDDVHNGTFLLPIRDTASPVRQLTGRKRLQPKPQ